MPEGPIARLDDAWQRLEARLCAGVIVAEIASLTLWVSLKGLSTDTGAGAGVGGLAFRGAATAVLMGLAVHAASRGMGEARRRAATTAAVVVGLWAGRFWEHAGVHAASNVLNWLQNASVLMLIGGLRGLATRLTLWLALLGASLATSLGKHVHVDVLLRYAPARLRAPAAVVGPLAAAVMCALAAVGFADHIAIAAFRAPAVEPCAVDAARSCETTVGERAAVVRRGVASDWFLLGRQASLDARTLPRVIAGAAYDRWMTAAEWDAWLDGADWAGHFGPAAAEALKVPPAPGAFRMPQVAVPGTGEDARGLLVRDLDFVFPAGLAAIAVKMLLRVWMAVAGRRGSPGAGEGDAPAPPSARGARWALGACAAAVAAVGVGGGAAAALFAALALLGVPLFAVMGGSAEWLWMAHPDRAYHHLRFLAPTVMDERFAGSPILVTIPLFTFVGYLLAEGKTPDRLVAAARAALGWMPGGLAIVAVLANAAFTVLTGGSGVTIVAIGGLLYPALRKQRYSESFSLGLVTTGGSVGLLLPYSLPLLVYALVAHVDFNEAFKAVVVPGMLVLAMLAAYSVFVGVREDIDRERATPARIAGALWGLKWELGIPVLLVGGLGTGLASIDEVAALVAFYAAAIEFFVHRDLSWRRDLVRVAKASMGLAGAILLILAMANALMNYVVDQHVPTRLLEAMTAMGVEHMWQFLLVMNAFLLVLGMLMEGFSAILVAVPLIVPFVARLGSLHPAERTSPFQLATIFLLNLEIAYCLPPLGLNLFIASFRFNRPVSSLYRVVAPFVGILVVGLGLVTYVPWLSNVAVAADVAASRAKAQRDGVAPRDAWMMECVQEDPSHPQPCSPEDAVRFPGGQLPAASPDPAGGAGAADDDDAGAGGAAPGGSGAECNPDFDDCSEAGASAK